MDDHHFDYKQKFLKKQTTAAQQLFFSVGEIHQKVK
jgi:hypothetical protein